MVREHSAIAIVQPAVIKGNGPRRLGLSVVP